MKALTLRIDAHVGERYAQGVFASSIGKSIPLRWGPPLSLTATPLAPGEAVPLPPVREGAATLVDAQVVDDGTAVLLTFQVPDEVTAIMPSGILRRLGVQP